MRLSERLREFVSGLKKKHPGIFTFISARISTKRFAGLPLTILSFIFLFTAFLLSELIESVLNSTMLVYFDETVAKLLYASRITIVAQAMYAISYAGNEKVVAAIAITFSIILAIRKRWMVILTLWVTVAGSVLTILAGKHIFKISRPYAYSYYHVSLFSFPSGHASISIAFYGLLAYYFIRETKSLKIQHRILTSAIIFIFLVGFSRIYLCVHFFSDVVGGYFFGSLWLLLAISFFEWYEDKLKHRIQKPL